MGRLLACLCGGLMAMEGRVINYSFSLMAVNYGRYLY